MKNKNVYRIDFKKLVHLILPIGLRQPLIKIFYWCCIYPIKQLHQIFLNWKKTVEDRLTYNSQIVYLQKAINDAIDPHLRRIYIKNNNEDNRVLLYSIVRQKPVIVGRVPITSINYKSNHDFVVMVPKEVQITDKQKTQLINIVDTYKIYSKNYIIEYGK